MNYKQIKPKIKRKYIPTLKKNQITIDIETSLRYDAPIISSIITPWYGQNIFYDENDVKLFHQFLKNR